MVEAPVQPVFSTESMADELPADRPVRISGFLALGLGILSGCVVFSMVFLPLPILTLIVAGIALRPSARGVPVGRSAAYAGAVLAIFFGSWGWSQVITRNKALQQQATRFAQDWLAILQQGDAELALELTQPPEMRLSEEMPLDVFYQQNETAQENLQGFSERPLVPIVLAGGESLRWELAERPIVTRQKSGDEVIVRLKETTGTIDGMVQIDLRRLPDAATEAAGGEWYVGDFAHRHDQ